MSPLDRWFPRIVLAAGTVLCCLSCPAQAEPSRVDAAQVCAIQAKIRWRESAWPMSKCEAVAAALNATAYPRRSLARMINESDMRATALRITVRPDGLVAYDVGAMAVRCLVYPWESIDSGRCINGPVRGLSIRQLMDARVNIERAEAILASHGGSESRYNGATTAGKGRRYVGRLDAIEAALGGVLVKVREARIAKLCRQIVEAMKGEPRT